VRTTELRGKCLSDTEIPPNCAIALLNRLGWGSWIRDSASQVCQGLVALVECKRNLLKKKKTEEEFEW
jgi:hypothetical protein